MARNSKKETYRMVTPPHMDITLNFKSQTEAIDEAKRRGTYNRTALFVRNVEGEWQLIYDSGEDKDIERRRLAREDFNENWVDPHTHTLISRILGRNPIDYVRRRKDGGMSVTSVFVSKDEDPLPIVRTILMSPDFICWPFPGYTEKMFIRHFEPCGNNASYLLNEAPRQLELFH